MYGYYGYGCRADGGFDYIAFTTARAAADHAAMMAAWDAAMADWTAMGCFDDDAADA